MEPFFFVRIFGFVLTLVVIALGYDLLKTWMRSKRHAPAAADESLQLHLEQLARLEERLEVLERIMMDERSGREPDRSKNECRVSYSDSPRETPAAAR